MDSEGNNLNLVTGDYIAGLTDGEGCFYINLYRFKNIPEPILKLEFTFISSCVKMIYQSFTVSKAPWDSVISITNEKLEAITRLVIGMKSVIDKNYIF